MGLSQGHLNKPVKTKAKALLLSAVVDVAEAGQA